MSFGASGRSRRTFALAYVLPALAVLTLAVLPLIAGSRTLFVRDVFGTHLEMKSFQAEAMRAGRLPLVDPWRAGGQAHLGNPNTVPLYPDNLLYLVAPVLWALNAHFWIHLLLAPLGIYWLARASGLGREAAWTGGVVYAVCGYVLSTLNLYNLVAVAALAPALAAAALELAAGRRRRVAAVALLWALLLCAGDPMTAAMALILALTAMVAAAGPRLAHWPRRPVWLRLGGGLTLGTLVALPQLVEFARILPHTFRGHWRYSPEGATAASWDPRAAVEWLVPLFFGRPDLGYWGRPYSGGDLPLFFSLAPGVLALALVATSGRPRKPLARWAWAAVLAGIFVALGRHNPLLEPLLRLPGLDLLRLPVKFWLLTAVGGSLLAALGFERLTAGESRGFRRCLGLLAALLGGGWLFLSFGGGGAVAWARGWIPTVFPAAFVETERVRWAGICLVTLVLLGLAAAALEAGRRRPLLLALLPLLHLASQLFFLRPLLATEPPEIYAQPPPLLAQVPPEARVVHGDAGGLFGERRLAFERYPDLRLIWFQRQTSRELYPWTAGLWRRHYELNPSPEGLDAFLTRVAAQAVGVLPDDRRLRLLAATGVDRLLLGRPLEVEAGPGAPAGVELLHREPTLDGHVYVYRLGGAAPSARVAGRVLRAPHLNAAVELLTSDRFDPRTDVVLQGDGPPVEAPSGSVRWLVDESETMELEAETPAGGVLVLQRTLLPLYRGTVDGRPVPLLAADIHRIGVELAPGRHRVRIRTDRTPLRLSLAVSLAALLATALVGLRPRSS